MNKYAATGILIDAYEGKRFVIVERDGRAVQQALRVFADTVEHLGEAERVTIRRANGDERVDVRGLGRGTIRFATPRGQRLRGLSVDVVFIDNEAHRVLESDGVLDFDRYNAFREDVAVALSGSGGKVVHS
ncbi:hypothetical protein SK224_05485 [Microbacterium sp. BG28]|uniref:hypothetical protein n=1 Tax=Microbacterium sp. BG28 TaxID=3097356 RepID=UPI002A5A2FFB|nr:hypothetical protein [Microbacterium sp. BG28]MDY0828576.1 hypothetical protein [Microbacterium sp. BG28]